MSSELQHQRRDVGRGAPRPATEPRPLLIPSFLNFLAALFFWSTVTAFGALMWFPPPLSPTISSSMRFSLFSLLRCRCATLSRTYSIARRRRLFSLSWCRNTLRLACMRQKRSVLVEKGASKSEKRQFKIRNKKAMTRSLPF